MSSLSRVLVISLGVLATAEAARAQEATPPPAPTAPEIRGPRLLYTRGSTQCLDEENFRREVAIANDDGADHFDATAPDTLRVWFEKLPWGGYRGTIEYTDAQGKAETPRVQVYYNCEILGRVVGTSAADYIPDHVPLAAPPAPVAPCPPPPAAPPPLPALKCPACETFRPPVPPPPRQPAWRMDLTVGFNTYVMMTAFLSANVAPAVGIGGEVRGENFGVAAEFRFVVPSVTYARDPVPGATSTYPQEFDLSQISVLLVPCARYKYFVGCGVAQLSGLMMQNPVALQSALSFGFGPRVGFEVPFADRFAVFGFGEVLFSPVPVGLNFVLPDPDKPDGPIANTRWEQSVASGFFGVGVSVKFR